MSKKNDLTNEGHRHRRIVDTSGALPKKIRFGAPDGPRRRHNENYDGRVPLEYSGHEAVAQYLASPNSVRQFKNPNDLAKCFHVSRMTIYRWAHDPDVIQRAHFLSEINQMAGDLIARQEWPRIMQTAVRRAIEGDLPSIRFCESRAFPKELRVEQSGLSATVSIHDLLGTSESDDVEKLADDNQQMQGDDQ